MELLCREVEKTLGLDMGAMVEERFIDAVAISHEFTDHCHRQTLEELDPSTPIFANDVCSLDHSKHHREVEYVLMRRAESN